MAKPLNFTWPRGPGFLCCNKESRHVGMVLFKHPPTEASEAQPWSTAVSLRERQLESGFGGWVDEKIKLARAAHPHVVSRERGCAQVQENPFNIRNSHTQHLTVTHLYTGRIKGAANQRCPLRRHITHEVMRPERSEGLKWTSMLSVLFP
jgi:hypothetical protein